MNGVKNAALPEDRRMQFRIGINLGDVIEEGERIYGDGVNIAARIEGLTEGGGICISGSAYEQIENKLALGYEYLGEITGCAGRWEEGIPILKKAIRLKPFPQPLTFPLSGAPI